jgi:hypothetical protein
LYVCFIRFRESGLRINQIGIVFTMKKNHNLFPIHTTIAEVPITHCRSLPTRVFDYPFFNEGVQEIRKKQHHIDYPTLDDLKDTPVTHLLELKGFIFHTSHCGSTLLTRMLQTSDQIRVVSEPEAINGLLLAYKLHTLSKADVQQQLQRIIESYRQPLGEEKYLIFKCTSWNVFMIDLFLELYPTTKSIYIDRKIEEVVTSLLKSDGGVAQWWDHPVDNLRKYFTGEDYQYTTKGAYLKHMVEQHRKQVAIHTNKTVYKITYPTFLNNFEKVLTHFELTLSSQEIETAEKATAYYSKSTYKKVYVEGD